MTMTPPDAQDPDDLPELSDEERELLPDADRDATPDEGLDPTQAVQVDDDNVPHPPSEEH
jgi:hypothetical protein